MSSEKKHSALNPSQRHRLLITCKHIDKLLGDIEAAMDTAASKRLFMPYIDDITPQQRRTIEEHITRIRAQLLQVLERQSMAPEGPQVSAAHSIEVGLSFVEIAIEELDPRHMRGYGPVSEQGGAELQKAIEGLLPLVKELHRYVLQSQPAQRGLQR